MSRGLVTSVRVKLNCSDVQCSFQTFPCLFLHSQQSCNSKRDFDDKSANGTVLKGVKVFVNNLSV